MTHARKLYNAPEVLGATLSPHIEDFQEFKNDPKSYIYNVWNMEIDDDVSVNAVENKDMLVHLALPYYSHLKHRIGSIADENMDSVAGGDALFFLQEQELILAKRRENYRKTSEGK